MKKLPTSPKQAQQWFKTLRWWLHPAYDRLQKDPFARLLSFEEVPVAITLGIQIDANQATVDDWLRLPGISIHQARTLTALSHSGIAFHCLEDVAAAIGIPCRQIGPLRPILSFCYYDPASAVTLQPIWLHQATASELMALPGMSSELAERILNERRRSPFADRADFHHRLRLTPEQTTRWLYYLRL